ncbi:MAG: branched-chain amino acid ABC transporter permease [Xanthobacteraceae bacterium]|nr:MAG: branched-chain amino acid ABC transporter permease [Xanthobacteraceae bacterium]
MSSRFTAIAILIAVLALLPLVLPNAFYFDLVIRIMINAVIAIALNLLIGYTGQISLGHAGFFGIGAYGSAILTARYNMPPLLSLAIATLAAAALAWLVAGAILRLKGHYLAMATLGLGIIISIILNNEAAWTGGPDGMSVDTFRMFGLRLAGEQSWYWMFAGLLVASIVLAQNLVDSPAGRALQALHGSEVAASVVGIDTAAFKTRVFVVSAGTTAAMGGLAAFYMGFITPNLAAFQHSIELMTMVVVGGMASVYGSVFGAALLSLLPQALARVEGWETVIFGFILVGTMIFMPRGIVPSIAALLRKKDA